MSLYKQAKFVEVGRTYHIMVNSEWVKVILVKILNGFAIVHSKGEEFSVPFADLYMLD